MGRPTTPGALQEKYDEGYNDGYAMGLVDGWRRAKGSRLTDSMRELQYDELLSAYRMVQGENQLIKQAIEDSFRTWTQKKQEAIEEYQIFLEQVAQSDAKHSATVQTLIATAVTMDNQIDKETAKLSRLPPLVEQIKTLGLLGATVGQLHLTGMLNVQALALLSDLPSLCAKIESILHTGDGTLDERPDELYKISALVQRLHRALREKYRDRVPSKLLTFVERLETSERFKRSGLTQEQYAASLPGIVDTKAIQRCEALRDILINEAHPLHPKLRDMIERS